MEVADPKRAKARIPQEREPSWRRYDLSSCLSLSSEARLSKDVFAVSSSDAILNTSKHEVLELAFGRERNPFASAYGVHHAIELRVDADLRGARSSWRDLETKGMATSHPASHINSWHLAIMLELALCSDSLYEDYGLC